MSASKGFFAVDARCARKACEVGLNAALGYLVLARHTQADQVSTAAGASAIAKAMRLSRGRVARALLALEGNGLVSRAGAAYRRRLASWAETRAPALTDRQRQVVKRLARKRSAIRSSSDPDYQVAHALVGKGLLRCEDGRIRRREPEWLWLPNTICDGFGDAHDRPLNRLRQIGDARAVMLLLDCYARTNLAEDGGLHWSLFREEWTRAKVGQSGRFVVFGFVRKRLVVWPRAFGEPYRTGPNGDGGGTIDAAFWDAWQALTDAGFVETVPHLVEADTEEAQPVHAYGIETGEPEERALAEAAHAAGLALVTAGQVEWAERHFGKMPWLCPVPAHMVDAQMIGIARPRHRPQTRRTAAWAARFLYEGTRHEEVYASIRENFETLAA